jgi:phage tail protein X
MSDAGPVIGQKYVVRGGDTITEIAFIAYGDARRYVELVEHNKGLPGFNPARLRPGLELDIPEPTYLPLPGGVGGFRSSAGRSLQMRAAAPPPPRPVPVSLTTRPSAQEPSGQEAEA